MKTLYDKQRPRVLSADARLALLVASVLGPGAERITVVMVTGISRCAFAMATVGDASHSDTGVVKGFMPQTS